MDTSTGKTSIFTLLRHVLGNSRTFIRQEVQLAKTEISEKFARLGKNSVLLAIGAFVAYGGLIVLLIGLGWLAGWGLEKAGLSLAVAASLGILAVGLLATVTGVVLLLKGLSMIKRDGLKPERTLYTLQELKTSQPEFVPGQKSAEPPSAEQLQARVEATEFRLSDDLDELGRRLSPSHIKAQVTHKLQEKPYHAGFAALLAGLISGLLLRKKFSRTN